MDLPAMRVRSIHSNSSEEETLFKDDLNFLNKLEPNQIAKLSSMFRNEGRGHVKQDRLFQEKNKLTPVVGSYRPNHAAV